MVGRRGTAVGTLAVLLLACEAVPDLRFVTDAGPADAPPGTDAGVDADPVDGGDAAGASDAATCTQPAPAGGSCCGTVWCVDQCGPDNCYDCARAGCAPGEICCGKQGTVQCKVKCP